jgi:predicted nucleic acid-binding protein
MTGTLVDSNILIDVLAGSSEWADRSAAAIRSAGADGPLVINEVIYAEVSVRYADTDELDRDLPIDYFQREHDRKVLIVFRRFQISLLARTRRLSACAC